MKKILGITFYFHYYYLHYSSRYGSLIITCFWSLSPIFPHRYLLPLCEADGPPHLSTYYVSGILLGILQILFYSDHPVCSHLLFHLPSGIDQILKDQIYLYRRTENLWQLPYKIFSSPFLFGKSWDPQINY